MLGELLTRYLRGYVSIKISGKNPEKLLNLALNHGIPLWNLRRKHDGLEAQLQAAHFRKLRPLVRKTGNRPRLQKRGGLPFQMKRLGKRRGFVAGAFLFVVLLYTLSSFIWFIEVNGTVTMDRAEILSAARELGLKPGRFQRMIELEEVERGLLARVPGLAWVGITLSGTKAMIKIVEKKILLQDEARIPGDLVARADGLIDDLIVLNGQAVVVPGATVREGQVLVRGLKELPDGSVEAVKAYGIIKARVWRTVVAEVPLEKTTEVPTGRTWRLKTLKIGPIQVILRKGRDPGFARYDELEERKPFRLGPVPFPVEIRIVTRYELRPEKRSIDLEEARQEAIKAAFFQLGRVLREGSVVVERRIDVSQPRPDLVRAEVVVETTEDIGMFRPALQGTPPESSPPQPSAAH
ncbi:MAG: sporulation protein YqfD [Firmicutes bacterium]|nr:sporulation protein YqfD [Bacillota bacterium]